MMESWVDPDHISNDIKYKELLDFLLKERGFLLSAYKKNYISRRIASRLHATRCRSLSDYVRLVKDNQDELNNLYDKLTINVSSFFRNEEVFGFLAGHVFPAIVQQKIRSGTNFINIWSFGCSTGEEPYSIALLIYRKLRIKLRQFRISIKAVDIDAKALDFAKKGIYSRDRLTNLDPKIIRSCFIRDGESYRIRDLFREMIDFQQEDILAFNPIKEVFDLILCRNMLIYFTKENHLKVYKYFSDHLDTGGYLVLGGAEIMLNPGKNRFELFSVESRVYRKTD